MLAASASIPGRDDFAVPGLGHVMTLKDAQTTAVRSGKSINFKAVIGIENILVNGSGHPFIANFCGVDVSGRACNKTVNAGFPCANGHINRGGPRLRWQMSCLIVDKPDDSDEVVAAFKVVLFGNSLAHFFSQYTTAKMRAMSKTNKAAYMDLLTHDTVFFNIVAVASPKGYFKVNTIELTQACMSDEESPASALVED